MKEKKRVEKNGQLEKEKEIAKKMKELNMPDSQICEILNITQKELEKIIG